MEQQSPDFLYDDSHKMSQNVALSRKQTQFLQGLLLGQTIEAASAAIGITGRTAHRWLKLPEIIAERERLETQLRQAEEAEITRIMTTGYAAIHERVKALDYQAHEMEKPYTSETGNVYHLRNSPDHMREWRGLLDDIAKETGGRVKMSKTDMNGSIDLSHRAVFVLPELDDEELAVQDAPGETA